MSYRAGAPRSGDASKANAASPRVQDVDNYQRVIARAK
jgi:hypothetical protein